ncbi:MAG: class I SAM-dependent methyltransferase [Balneolaceae bacterium]
MKQHDPDAVVLVERETWNRSADSYIGNAAKLTTHAVNLLLEEARLTNESRALEVGCGPGYIAKMMADSGARVTGVDLAPRMIEVASRLYPDIEFKEANAEQLPFDTDTFDVVLINFAIHHFARPVKACAEIRRVLKPGGRFVFAGPIEQFGFGAFIEGLTSHHTMDELPHGPIYLGATQQDYENLMREAGFGDYDVTIRQLSLRLENLDPLIQTGWEMCELSSLPQATQDKIRETTIEKASPYKTDRGYEFPDRVVVGIAKK